MQVSVIYKITSLSTGRVYVGTSKNPRERCKQHMRNPPVRMREVHQQFGRGDFVLTCLAGVTSSHRVDSEGFHIKKYNATGPEGFNNLPCGPGKSRKWWAIYIQEENFQASALQYLIWQFHLASTYKSSIKLCHCDSECDSAKPLRAVMRRYSTGIWLIWP